MLSRAGSIAEQQVTPTTGTLFRRARRFFSAPACAAVSSDLRAALQDRVRHVQSSYALSDAATGHATDACVARGRTPCIMAASAGELASFSIAFSSVTALELLPSEQCSENGSTALSMRRKLPTRRKSAQQHGTGPFLPIEVRQPFDRAPVRGLA